MSPDHPVNQWTEKKLNVYLVLSTFLETLPSLGVNNGNFSLKNTMTQILGGLPQILHL